MTEPVSPAANSSATADTEMTLLLSEYDQVKSEQRNRIQHRDGLVYTTLAALAAVVAATVSQHSAAILLLLPPVAIVLGWKYLSNDEKIGTASRYVRERLSPRVDEIVDVTGPVFGWESFHRAGVFRRVRRHVQRRLLCFREISLPLPSPHALGLLALRHSGH